MSILCSKSKNLASNHFLMLLSFVHKILKTYIIVVFVLVVMKTEAHSQLIKDKCQLKQSYHRYTEFYTTE